MATRREKSAAFYMDSTSFQNSRRVISRELNSHYELR